MDAVLHRHVLEGVTMKYLILETMVQYCFYIKVAFIRLTHDVCKTNYDLHLNS